jgi:hypothetical protein
MSQASESYRDFCITKVTDVGFSYAGYAEFHFEVTRVSDGQKVTN